jgi:peroxiredoxin Q/BCP
MPPAHAYQRRGAADADQTGRSGTAVRSGRPDDRGDREPPVSETPAGPIVGAPAPTFRLPSSTGGDLGPGDFRGEQALVLYFYPKDDTSGCTAEACQFRDLRAEFAARGAAIVGVSPDPLKSHARFIGKHGLTFPLLADEGARVCQQYGVWKEKSMYGRKYMGVERTTFLIDRDGLVRKVYRKVSVTGHADAVLKDLAAL